MSEHEPWFPALQPRTPLHDLVNALMAEQDPDYAAPGVCVCGHPFLDTHRTPGTECSVLGCECGRFQA